MTISQRIEDAPEASGVERKPVSSQNEWDPLEEVVLGRLDGAAAETPAIPADETRRDLDALQKLLTAEGVTVHRPDPTPHGRTFETADWKERGFSAACPRDAVLVVDDEIIEMPLGWRARYYETDGLKSLFLRYFRDGARWACAPRPELKDELYEEPGGEWLDDARPPAAVTEAEPILCAADIARKGFDLFAMCTAGTNQAGITWLERHLGTRYRVHQIQPRRPVAGQLDTLFLPLSPEEILIREDAIDPTALPSGLRDSRIRIAPEANDGQDALALNVLMLDRQRVLVEATQTNMIDALRTWGYDAIPTPLAGYAPLGGSLRRATLDIRRRTGPRA